jgi:hypothetical protein
MLIRERDQDIESPWIHSNAGNILSLNRAAYNRHMIILSLTEHIFFAKRTCSRTVTFVSHASDIAGILELQEIEFQLLPSRRILFPQPQALDYQSR